MGQRRIDTVQKIQDETNRYVTFCKRKRGLLKKTIELSRLCDQYVYIVIFDQKKQRLVEYRSVEEFTSSVINKLVDPKLDSKIMHERYTNEDYDLFSKEQLSAKEIFEHNVKRSRKVTSIGSNQSEHQNEEITSMEATIQYIPKKRGRKSNASKMEDEFAEEMRAGQSNGPLITVDNLNITPEKLVEPDQETKNAVGKLLQHSDNRIGRGPSKYRRVEKQRVKKPRKSSVAKCWEQTNDLNYPMTRYLDGGEDQIQGLPEDTMKTKLSSSQIVPTRELVFVTEDTMPTPDINNKLLKNPPKKNEKKRKYTQIMETKNSNDYSQDSHKIKSNDEAPQEMEDQQPDLRIPVDQKFMPDFELVDEYRELSLSMPNLPEVVQPPEGHCYVNRMFKNISHHIDGSQKFQVFGQTTPTAFLQASKSITPNSDPILNRQAIDFRNQVVISPHMIIKNLNQGVFSGAEIDD